MKARSGSNLSEIGVGIQGLPILEVEGSNILDPEDLPPYPGEAPNWSNYGTYLQDLYAYNSTGINVPQTSATSPNSKQILCSSPSASTSQRILRSYTSASTSQRILRSYTSASTSQRILRTSTASSTLNLSKAAKCTFKSVPSPAASTRTTVTTRSMKKSKRWKVDKIQRKSKGLGLVLSEEETEKEPAQCKKEKEADKHQMLEEPEPMKRGQGRPTSKR
ncbi:unnamed protein product [Orchesella dallaii]|uniref:Uncharacterized protein n=1 Tax=Orchesella dallaii TaxID=48710 RepID=A0ABP1R518_9HEXA